MKYIEITIQTESEWVEQVLACLSMAGIDDAEVRDPRDAEEIMADKETYEWDYVDAKVSENLGRKPEIHIYRNSVSETEDEALLNSIRSAVGKLKDDICSGLYGEQKDPGEMTVSSEIKDDSIWKDKWKEYFKPSHVSDSIVVKPTWEEYDPDDGEIVIEIDPGMAFGTGTHETTSLSLKLMEKHVKRGDRVLDVGTGSGILAIAAAKLGASDILGIDIDQDAVRVANENIANNIAPTSNDANVRAVVGDLTEGIDFTADVVVANLLADLVMKLTSSVAKHMADDAIYITSGILVEKQKQVAECLTENNFTIVEILEDGEWCAIAAVGNDD